VGENMTINEITKIVWKYRRTFKFGGTRQWEDTTFLKKWYDKYYPGEWTKSSETSGWYWFEFSDNIDILRNTQEPKNRPKNGCQFRSQSAINVTLFEDSLAHSMSGVPVVYNGHEANTLGRVRSHFALNNDKTGALGINSYPTLSKKAWSVSIFHKGYIDSISDLSESRKAILLKFCNSKTGRTAIEQNWRSQFGWPLLSRA
jgi:hypothetical protein